MFHQPRIHVLDLQEDSLVHHQNSSDRVEDDQWMELQMLYQTYRFVRLFVLIFKVKHTVWKEIQHYAEEVITAFAIILFFVSL